MTRYIRRQIYVYDWRERNRGRELGESSRRTARGGEEKARVRYAAGGIDGGVGGGILNLGGSIDFTIWTPPKVKNKPSRTYSTLIECLSSARLVSTHQGRRGERKRGRHEEEENETEQETEKEEKEGEEEEEEEKVDGEAKREDEGNRRGEETGWKRARKRQKKGVIKRKRKGGRRAKRGRAERKESGEMP